MTTLRGAVTAGVIAASAALAIPGGGTTEAASASDRATMIAQAGVVFVTVTYTGKVRDAGGQVHGPYFAGGKGTGWFVTPDGMITTATHVALPTPETIRDDLTRSYVLDVICHGATACPKADAGSVAAQEAITTTVETVLQPPRVVTQDQFQGADDMALYAEGTPATVVRSSPETVRDLTVLHIDSHNDPVLPLRPPGPLPLGTGVVLIGYPEGSRPPVPTLTTGAVTQVSPPRGSQLAMVGPRTIVIGTTAVGSPGYSGGPGIDDQGNAVGSTDFAPSELSKSTSRGTFLVSADDIRSELAQVGVTPRSGPGDVQRRAGFAAYDRGDYPAAAAAFHVCASLGAVNVQCADWEGFANDKQSPVAHAPPVSAAKPASSIGAPVLIGGAAVGAVILVAAVARLLIRRHRSRQRSWLGSSGGRR